MTTYDPETLAAIAVVTADPLLLSEWRAALRRLLPAGHRLQKDAPPLIRALEIVLSRVPMYDALTRGMKYRLASERAKAAHRARRAAGQARARGQA